MIQNSLPQKKPKIFLEATKKAYRFILVVESRDDEMVWAPTKVDGFPNQRFAS